MCEELGDMLMQVLFNIHMAEDLGYFTMSDVTSMVTEKLIYRLAREGCKVIFLTEPLFACCTEAINKFKSETFPAIIPIPDSHGASGVAMANIKANVEKAIGADILFSEDR